MPAITPASAGELAAVLAETASRGHRITLLGNNSKRLMAGPVAKSDVTISTAALRQVLQYEPNDLTVSVEAGLPFAELQAMLAEHGQMIALDPPFSQESTVGGVVASNCSGPLRRAFGTARDLVIGMTFATLEGKLIKSGGMVVKNVAGLDMGKLMIGSFGTLAAITSVNFRVHSRPENTRTFLFTYPALESAIEKRDAILKSVLQPIAFDLLSPVAAMRVGYRGYLLAVRAGGSPVVLGRYERDLGDTEILPAATEKQFWRQIKEFTPDFLHRQSGMVLRISTTVTDLTELLRLISGPSISRAASGITYVYLPAWQSIAPFLKAATERGWTVAVEFASDEIRGTQELWYQPALAARDNALILMKRMKQMFDPANLLNSARLYGRI